MTKKNPIYGQGSYESESRETTSPDPWHERYKYGPHYRGFPEQKQNDSGTKARGYKRDDDKVWDDVCDALANAYDVDASEMEVDVENSVVYLSGAVNTREEAWQAEQIAWDIPGVEQVRNRVEIKYY